MTARPKVAVVAPYWDFWESSVNSGLRAHRVALLTLAMRAVSRVGDVVASGLVADRDQGGAFAETASGAGADVVVVVQTMAVPPAFAFAALDALPGLPVVVWAVPGAEAPDEGFDHGAITAGGATVGAPMVTSLLVRSGRPFALVVGSFASDAPDRAASAVMAGWAAGRISRARIGRVGMPIDGYDCVDADEARLRDATGITLVPIAPSEVRDRFAAVKKDRVSALVREMRTDFRVQPDAEPGLAGSARAALALEDLVSDHRLDAGAMNCHVPEIRLSEPIGLAPCFGLGRMTSLGVPWACAGDVLTAVAMLTTKLLGGAAVYHELEALDAETGDFVVANSGEHDLAFAADESPDLIRNRWFPDDPGQGVCACVSAPAGPATLLAFAQIDAPSPGYRYVVAPGDFSGRSFPATGTTNGGFRFASGPAEEAWERWVRAGANHHSSASPGRLEGGVRAVARFLGVECVTA